MKHLLFVVAALVIPGVMLWLSMGSVQAAQEGLEDKYKTFGAAEAKKVVQAPKRWITTDHSKHEELKKDFQSAEEVIEACNHCHNEAAEQIHETIHWTWLCPHDPEKRMGKYGLTVNNFCIAVPSNEPRCTSCHVGFGFKDKSFDFSSENKVDCLVCHDSTGTYKKFPSGAGYPADKPKKFGGKKMFYPPDWNRVAQNVSRPGRDNCGECHFNGGGGDGVKHGDLDSSLLDPSKELDVHMNSEGANFDCVRCHTTQAHRIAGRCYKHPATEDPTKSLIEDDEIKRISCYSCHTDKPHEPGHKANDHTDMVACQSCHIPEFARVKPTKMYWDWSEAGKMKDGKPYSEKGPLGKANYISKKGAFVWGKNVRPEYFWFNGTLDYTLLTDTIDPSKTVMVNEPIGKRGDPNSRIYPFKVHRGKQPYDSVNNTLVIPHLFGKDKTAYWKNYDWQKALQAGMDYWGLPFSGEYDFVDSHYHYPTTHMVAPADNVVECAECHTGSDDGRLAQLAGFYMPGRDNIAIVEWLGWLVVLGSLAGVLGHAFLRMIHANRRKG